LDSVAVRLGLELGMRVREIEWMGGWMNDWEIGEGTNSNPNPNPNHQGSLKTLAVSGGGKYLCTGGTDERIRIFNVAENRSNGELGMS
jgi:WD40 repeat protein